MIQVDRDIPNVISKVRPLQQDRSKFESTDGFLSAWVAKTYFAVEDWVVKTLPMPADEWKAKRLSDIDTPIGPKIRSKVLEYFSKNLIWQPEKEAFS